jgi:translocation and assembly module TamB
MRPVHRRLATVIALLAALSLALFTWWHLRGDELLRTQIEARVNEQISGRLEVKSTHLNLSQFELTDIKLFDLDGHVVLRIPSAKGTYALGIEKLTLSSLTILKPELQLVIDGSELNLRRALAPREVPSRQKASSDFEITVERLNLEDAHLEFRHEDSHVNIEDLTARGHLNFHTQAFRATGEIQLLSRLTSPLESPLEGTISLLGTQLSTKLAVAESMLEGEVDIFSQAFSVAQLQVSPQLGQAVSKNWPLRIPLTLKASGSRERFEVRAQAGRCTVRTDGALQLQTRSIEHFFLQAANCSPLELFGRAPDTNISGTLEGSARHLTSLDEALADLHLTVDMDSGHQPKPSKGESDIHLEHGTLGLRNTKLLVDGATLSVSGTASLLALDLAGDLDVRDAKRATRVIESLTGIDVPLQGSGRLKIDVTGSSSHPRFRTRSSLAQVTYGDLRASSVTIDGELPNIDRPFDADVEVHVKQASLGAQQFGEFEAKLKTLARRFEFELKGLINGVPVTLSASGRPDPDALGAQLEAFAISVEKNSWTLRQAAPISFRHRRFSTRHFELGREEQRIQIDGSYAVDRLDGRIQATSLKLVDLSPLWRSSGIALGGTVSGQVSVQGSTRHPQVDFGVSLSQGAVAGVNQVDAQATGRFDSEALKLEANVASTLAAATLSTSWPLPLDALSDDRPIQFLLQVNRLSLSALQHRLPNTIRLSGIAAGKLELSGTRESPHLDFEWQAPDTNVHHGTNETSQSLKLTATSLVLKTSSNAEVEGHFETRIQDARLTGHLKLPIFRLHVPTRDELFALPWHFDATADGVSLQALREHLPFNLEPLGNGVFSLAANLNGSLNHPRGTLAVKSPVWQPGGLPDAQFTGEIVLSSAATEGHTEIHPTQGKGSLSVVIERPVEELLGAQSLRESLFRASAHVTNMAWSRQQGSHLARGVLSGDVALQGSLEKSILHASVASTHTQIDETSLGLLSLEIEGAPQNQHLRLALVDGPTGSRATLDGDVRSPLAQLLDADMSFKLETKALDLTFLSGIHPLVRTVGGTLDAVVAASGTLRNPRLSGSGALNRGSLALIGYGSFRDLDGAFEATDNTFSISKLRAQAGGGVASLQIQGKRNAESHWQFSGGATSDKFPLIAEDQLLATLTSKVSFEGTHVPGDINISTLEVSRADLVLPELKRKDLQTLERPTDILLFQTNKLQRAKTEGDAQPAFNWHANIRAPRNIQLKGSDVNVELGLAEDFRFDFVEGRTQLKGQADILRGNASVIGRKFEFVRESQSERTTSFVVFDGAPARPLVDVKAVYVTKRQPPTTVTVVLKGKFPDVTPAVSSEPPLNESQIYTLLATGRSELELGSGASLTADSAVSAIGQVVVNQVKKKLAKEVPIDVFNFEALDDFNFKIEVGKYISDTLFVGVTGQTAADQARGENAWAARLEWQLSRNVTLEAWGGTAPAAGLDVVWSADY